MPAPKILRETDDSFVVKNPMSGEEEEHPKKPGALSNLYEGLVGQSNSGDIQNKYMQSLNQIRKQRGWVDSDSGS